MGILVLRTHGGLGNQLFQVFYGRLISDLLQCELREVHDLRYAHKFERSEVPAISPPPPIYQSIVSSLRVPKILERVFGYQELPWKHGQDTYLDGYFQTEEVYRRFNESAIRKNLQKLAVELTINPATDDDLLIHLRVGDFFKKRDEARLHIFNRLCDIPIKSVLITNDEDLLKDDELSKLMLSKQARLISTKGFSAVNVLRTISKHRNISANDSTLTFWAHVLAGTQVKFHDVRLSALAEYLGQYGPWRYQNCENVATQITCNKYS
jgi:hypothetical protein